MSKELDVLVIGSGPGGYVSAIRASQLGFKTAIIEKNELGGICLNWGCIPTKALLKSAQVWNYVKNSESYGIHVGESKVDFKAIIKRSRKSASTMSKGIEFLLKKNKIEKIQGLARLDSNKNIIVENSNGNSIIKSKHIILATGGRPKSLSNIPIDNKKIIDYKKAMSLEKKPERLLIIGAGAIGVEFAYFYNSIGTKVTIVEYEDRLLPLEDKDISSQLGVSFKKKGIDILTSSKVESVDQSKDECIAILKNSKGEERVHCDIVLSAVGIDANIDSIGLDELGILKDKGKLKVDKHYSTNVTNIYAIGDIINTPALAHVASAEGIVCIENIANLNPSPINYNNIPSCTYCQPEVASTGITEEQARDNGYKIKVGKYPFSASGKATATGSREGFVKVIFDEKYGELLGAHFIGDNVTEMIGEMVLAKNLETTEKEIIKSIHPHPTMSESIMEAVANAFGEAIHL